MASRDGGNVLLERRWIHVVALTLVLLGTWLVIDPQVAYFSDEGAAATQARLLADGAGWTYEYRFAETDPGGVARPFLRGTPTDGGVAPYAKHPLYAVMLAGAYTLVGPSGFVLLSVAGTVVASAGAWALSARRGPGLAVASFWLTGLGSPLLFDSYLVVAHTLAAAATVWAIHGLVSITRPGERAGPGAWILVILGVGSSVALRSEALLFWLVVSVVLVAVAWCCRETRRTAVNAAVVIAGTMLVTRGIEVLAVGAIAGEAVSTIPGTAPSLPDRLSAAWLTVGAPSRGGRAVGDLLLLLSAAAVGAGVLALRAGRAAMFRVGLLSAVGLTVGAAFTRSAGAMPGILPVMPALVAAIAVIGWRSTTRSPVVRALAASCALFALAVLATQYAQGGGVEWGWRYLAVALPLIVVVVVDVLADVVQYEERARVTLVGSLGAMTCVLALMALHEMDRGQSRTAQVASAVGAAVEVVEGGDDGVRPVVLAVGRLLPELLWTEVEGVDWLALDHDDLEELGGRLADAGVGSVVLITPDPGRDIERLDGWAFVDAVEPNGGPVWVVSITRHLG